MGCIKLDILENHYKTPELKIVHAKKELTSKKSSSEGRNYYHARYYDPKIAMWYGVDPLAELHPDISSFAYCANNPVKLIDPDGRDWIETKKGIQWNKDVTGAKDADLPEGAKYLGKQGYDLQNYYNSDGTKSPVAFNLGEVTVTATQSDHARTMSNPVVKAMHEGQGEFLKYAWENPGTQILLSITPGVSLAKAGVGLLRFSTYSGMRFAARGVPKYLYHYTSKGAAQSISKSGLRVGKDGFSYLTNTKNLSPIQAQIELALPANRALPNSLLRINTSGLSPAAIRRVQGNLPGLGPGGGTEFLFNQTIPSSAIKIIR